MNDLDIIGYRYGRTVLCRDCIKHALPTGPEQKFDGYADTEGVLSAEEFLQRIADAFGIDRSTWSNASEFPVAVRPLDLVEGIPACDKCGEILL